MKKKIPDPSTKAASVKKEYRYVVPRTLIPYRLCMELCGEDPEKMHSAVAKIFGEMKDFAYDDPEAFSVEEYINRKQMSWKELNILLVRYPEFSNEYDQIKSVVGSRREAMAFLGHGEIPVWTAAKCHYHQRYADERKIESDLRKAQEEAEKDKIINLIMTDYATKKDEGESAPE